MNHFSDESIGMDKTAKGPRLGVGKTLANYEELAEGLEVIEKQLASFEIRILGQRETTDTPVTDDSVRGDRPEPGYIERFDDLAIRIHSSVNALSNITSRLNGVV